MDTDIVDNFILPVALPENSETGSVDYNKSVEFLTEAPKPVCSDRVARLIGWNVEVLLRLLKQIVARRNASETMVSDTVAAILHESLIVQRSADGMVLDEVKEIIELPRFDARAAKNQQDIESIALDPKVPQQLEEFLMTIGRGYRDNPCMCFVMHFCCLVSRTLISIIVLFLFNPLATLFSSQL